MAKSQFVAPNLDNATPTMILDEMGKLSIMEGQIKKLRAFYKEAYYARMGIEETIDGGYMHDDAPITVLKPVVKSGETFIATTSISYPERFDQTAFAIDHADLFAAYKKSKAQLTTRFALAAGVINPVVNDLIEQMKKELDLE